MSESLAVVQATNQTTGTAGTQLTTGILGPMSAVGAILFGAFGPVVLGNVAFDGFEVPQSIGWGGAQRVTTHKFVGGARVIDAMGPDDRDIGWSGTFLGFDAADRARAVDAMRVGGVAVPLVWSDFFYQVVIVGFEADFRLAGHIPYRVTCTVLVNAATQPNPAQPGAVQAVTLDTNTAAGYATDPGTVSAIGSAQTAVAAAAPTGLILGSTTYNAANLALQTATSTAYVAQQAADAVLVTQALAGGSNLVSGAGGLNTALAAASTSAQQAAAWFYLGRAGRNCLIGAA